MIRPLPTRLWVRLVVCALFPAALGGCRSLEDAEAPPHVRNVIVMINDGAGWGAWDAAAYWQYGHRRGAPYADFPARYAMRTSPLNTSSSPTHDATARVDYDPALAWSTEPSDDPALPFVGYRELARAATDSAAAGTALASGIKTYNNAINHDNFGRPVEPVTFVAKAAGKATGVVTSVPFTHATPAAFAAQNASRNRYHEIGRQMLTQGRLDLIMGTGAPGYNVNGTACDALAADESQAGCRQPDEFLATEDWQALQAARYVPAGARAPWKVIRSNEEFAALAEGTLRTDAPVLGVPRIARTLQQARERRILGADAATASGDRLVPSVPTLATMTRGAIAHLSARSDEGFFLMVEGGATDWAAHTSKCGTQWQYGACTSEPEYGRLIEETVDFNRAVAAVVAWVDAHSNWDETLLIVTTDHDNSMPMGPDAQTVAYQPVVNRGRGATPGISFRPTGNHSNALVPLWAKGAGADLFERRVRGRDDGYARHVGWNDGRYIDNTDVAFVVRALLESRPVEGLHLQRTQSP
ncbi:alkaline phosphatase [Luteimonas sp. FCS-9]|uniref:alkaline phosphatase n=1 Tax=Luteimonas sp. FCS-9 TaxID=1547516 RepID=UPI00063E9689|nr:alkaline phosphatase [Luteimonas sp. FCS-9]KLJ00835.1 PhoA [Luteimonas sp. FCS-9]